MGHTRASLPPPSKLAQRASKTRAARAADTLREEELPSVFAVEVIPVPQRAGEAKQLEEDVQHPSINYSIFVMIMFCKSVLLPLDERD